MQEPKSRETLATSQLEAAIASLLAARAAREIRFRRFRWSRRRPSSR
jgi:hypothetical protein